MSHGLESLRGLQMVRKQVGWSDQSFSGVGGGSPWRCPRGSPSAARDPAGANEWRGAGKKGHLRSQALAAVLISDEIRTAIDKSVNDAVERSGYVELNPTGTSW